MKLLDARIEWYKQYSNDPLFMVLLENCPKNNDFRYTEKDGLYVAEKNGVYSYKYYKGPRDGYGGHTFNIIMKDGIKKELIGPFSSRSSYVNAVGFGPCGDAFHIRNRKDFNRGYTFCASYGFSLELLKLAAKLTNCHLVKIVYKNNRLNLPDSNQEQFNIIHNDRTICHIDTIIPQGIEYTYCPSLDPNKLIKGS